jgi:hypothetical protein
MFNKYFLLCFLLKCSTLFGQCAMSEMEGLDFDEDLEIPSSDWSEFKEIKDIFESIKPYGSASKLKIPMHGLAAKFKNNKGEFTYYFPIELFKKLKVKSNYNYKDFAKAIFFHELAHLIQFNTKLSSYNLGREFSSRQIELIADFYAGYRFSSNTHKKFIDKDIVNFFAEIGDFQTTNNNHHGLPEERMRFFRNGCGLYLSGKSYLNDTEIIKCGIILVSDYNIEELPFSNNKKIGTYSKGFGDSYILQKIYQDGSDLRVSNNINNSFQLITNNRGKNCRDYNFYIKNLNGSSSLRSMRIYFFGEFIFAIENDDQGNILNWHCLDRKMY